MVDETNMKVEKRGHQLTCTFFPFPGGEIGVKVNVNDKKYWFEHPTVPHTIIARLRTPGDIFKLSLLKDAIQRADPYKRNIRLFMPYVPYARQDRVCDPGEPLSIAVFADFIANLGFSEVIVVDPHSAVTGAIFTNLTVITQFDVINRYHEFANRLSASFEGTAEKPPKGIVIVSPDSGSVKKTFDLAKYFGHNGFIRADKMRDMTTGAIKETIVYCDDFKGQDVVVFDDICDGGRTFIELAAVMKKKNAGRVVLFVTHGIFSKGVEVLFNGGIDEIWTTNSYQETFDERVKVFNLTTPHDEP